MKTLVCVLGLNMVAFALSPADEAKAKNMAREYIKDHLKAPATAIFSKETLCAPLPKADPDEAEGKGPTPECKRQTVAKLGDGPASVVYRATVDAQNSFGVLLRTKFQLHVYAVDGKWSVLDAADAVRALKEACQQLNESARLLHNRPQEDCDAKYPSVK